MKITETKILVSFTRDSNTNPTSLFNHYILDLPYTFGTVRVEFNIQTRQWFSKTLLGLLSGEPDYFGRNEISSGGDLSHYSSASLY